ncbi:MAG: hypothetical protein A3A33_04080 [Candidatus Yanofskybacteria bacterium RIFCSPLOWO2_01_FULL_49_25]|uniref:3'(2'),5'-bisphosphate nucleotidase CysQ n=1 Tax=Candidatus Yanofskybacteria bacterium RIFCSPLOWO2_01_FULL_49_25 TaxID=1802701 RepID=A0A1F8GTY8_9BACT|nr:MAG: hypothetical protein A3A33_04080 [Candidatus Yanofskybacteria bacterium RIFCSPLOWO2_01_FULL_49_25]
MSNHRPSDFAKRIIKLAEETGAILMSYYKKDIAVDSKNDDVFDPVTIADREADAHVRRRLGEMFPEDEILSEENDHIPADYSKRIWMVDPLDGTKEFLKHTDGFSVHIGLWSQGKILLGVVLAPALGRLFYAELGEGAYERMSDSTFRLIHVSSVKKLEEARLLTRTPSSERRPLDPVVDQLQAREKDPSSKIKICRIACGEAEATLHTNFRLSKWDTLAPELILTEAGGIMADIDGKPLDYTQASLRWERSIIAANNREILDQILAVSKNINLAVPAQ